MATVFLFTLLGGLGTAAPHAAAAPGTPPSAAEEDSRLRELCNCNSGSLERCGPLAVQAAAITAGRPTTLSEIDAAIANGDPATSLAELGAAARHLGLATAALRSSGEFLVTPDAPAIIPIVKRNGEPHFITAVARRGDQVLVLDVPFEPLWIELSDLRETYKWDGAALHVATSPAALPGLESDSRLLLRAMLSAVITVASYLLLSRLFRSKAIKNRVATPTLHAQPSP